MWGGRRGLPSSFRATATAAIPRAFSRCEAIRQGVQQMDKRRHQFDLSRRSVMQGAAALAGTAAFAGAGDALAQSKGRIVVGTWGGDYARLLNKNIDQPLLVAKGWEVVQDQAGDP